MRSHKDKPLPKEPFNPSDNQTSLFLSYLFQNYFELIKVINLRHRKIKGLRPTGLAYLFTLYAHPDGLTIAEITEIMRKKSEPYVSIYRLMSLGYIERSKGKKQGSWQLTPDIYFLTLSGIAAVENILNTIKR